MRVPAGRGAVSGGRPAALVLHLSLLLVLGAAATACVQYSGSNLSGRVRSWMSSSSFVSDNDTLIDDVARARLAVSQRSALELRTVCAGLEADAGTAYGSLPSPSSTLTATLNAAYEAFFKAASHCSGAGSVRDRSVGEALSQMASAERSLVRAAADLASLGIRWVPRR